MQTRGLRSLRPPGRHDACSEVVLPRLRFTGGVGSQSAYVRTPPGPWAPHYDRRGHEGHAAGTVHVSSRAVVTVAATRCGTFVPGIYALRKVQLGGGSQPQNEDMMIERSAVSTATAPRRSRWELEGRRRLSDRTLASTLWRYAELRDRMFGQSRSRGSGGTGMCKTYEKGPPLRRSVWARVVMFFHFGYAVLDRLEGSASSSLAGREVSPLHESISCPSRPLHSGATVDRRI